MAREKMLDLVEVVPTAVPPVCRILDFKKFIYEQKKKFKEAKKKQRQTQLKEIRLTPEISELDYSFKKAHVEDFLKEGHRVKVSVSFRGREMLHKERGYGLIQKLIAEVSALAKVEKSPREEGRFLNVILVPQQ